jgi:hypothetical protein
MCRALFAIACLSTTLVTSAAFAFQETHQATVASFHMDHSTRTCTIRIEKAHPMTTATARCKAQLFSWGCLSDDYRFELARMSKEKRMGINIRYSEYDCHPTGNMLLLTVW